tara:strand:+ start:44 stop:955 length:912 start_codon:yes stop_codon:yes gene_type:complete
MKRNKMKKNILFVAVFTPNSTNISQSRGLKNIGYNVDEYDFRAISRNLNSHTKRDIHLINHIKSSKPDIILFSKADGINPDVIDECNKYATTILWYMDALHNFTPQTIRLVQKINYFICGVPGVVYEGIKYNQNTFFIEQCYDDEFNYPMDNIEKTIDISFIANIDPHPIHSNRQPYIDFINKNFQNFQHINGIYGLEHNKIVNSSKININICPTDKTGASVRLHKLLAAKSFVMTTPWIDMDINFTPNKDFIIFDSPEEFKEKAIYYLNNPIHRDIIRTNGYNTIQNHHPNKWAENIMNLIP